ncbi:ATP-grasp domain-containing protein [Thiothrix subterranea]|uniref:ATP-grasp domain-containing protein n=1 Tax=Thiothrix subterranea TaxID=2735563 RepID=A0AA51MKN5_9GAMM|nr:ATP-grasp domain-containing protein [Thiothrix subterranea]MDQ5769651.1 ATP-grasp domain-containing protein [Thiothrix subterranea]WML85723.1 ATP-grasp domain-containing protein [Thiothrix subterranea]
MRIWFNKTFSSITAVFNNLRQARVGQGVTIVSTHTNPAASVFLAADEAWHEPPGLVGAAYLDWCLNFCQQHRIDYFWPAKEAVLIVRHQADFAQVGTQVIAIASPETLTLLNHKGEFYRTVPFSVAAVMACIAVTDSNGFDQAVAELSQYHAALCVKPAVSVFGLGFRILDTQRDSITHLLDGVEYEIPLAELRAGMVHTPTFPELLVMEHLPGEEWSVDCAGRNGQLLCAIQRKKHPQAGYGQEIDNNAAIQGMVERLTVYYGLNGLFNIQFKANAAGEPRLLEINPRPSGGFGMACMAGVNLAEVFLQNLQGETLNIAPLRYGLRVSEVSTPVVLQPLS